MLIDNYGCKYTKKNRNGQIIQLFFTYRQFQHTLYRDQKRIKSPYLHYQSGYCIDNQKIITFLNGLYNFEVFNYQRGEKLFMSLLDDPVWGVYAGINLSALQNAKAELMVSDRNYNNSIYITQKKANESFIPTQEKPDYQQSLTTITNILSKNKRNPYLWYNLGNIHLQMQEFDKAVDDYTKAIQYEPNLAEAYYNRALTLLYLNKKSQAIKDLSKAGELGIQDAYVVMKRFN